MKKYLITLLFLPLYSLSQDCDTIYPSQFADTIIYCINDASCHSICDGEITVTVVGSNQPYYFEWGSSGAIVNDNSRDSLCAGNYSVTITDNNGNLVDFQSNEIEEPSELGIFKNLINPTCFNYSDGSINITTLGTSPFSWSWTNGFNTEDLTDLFSGEYILTTTDSNNCFRIDTFNIIDPVSVSSSTISDTLSCIGICDASAIVVADAGFSPFTFLWDNGQTTDTAYNLCYGLNNVIITDSSGCNDTNEVFIVNPDTLQISNLTNDSSCFQICDGQLSVTIIGGKPPYNTSWRENGVEFNNLDTITDNNLCPGIYQLVFNDANQCVDSVNIPLVERDAFVLQDWVVNDSCFNSCSGEIEIQILNKINLPFIYDWSNGQSDTIISNLCSDTFSLTVIDSRLCRETYDFFVFEGDSIYIDSLIITDNNCFGDVDGAISIINVVGVVFPLSFEWSNGQITSSPAINSLSSGIYSFSVEDAFGCTYDSVNIEINSPDSLFVTESSLANTSCYGSNDGLIDLDIFGGVSPYFISWDQIISDSSLIDTVPAGEYIYTIIDSLLCVISDTLLIEEPEELQVMDSLVNILCKGENTGEIHLNISGGTSPYIYSIDNGINFQSQNYFNYLNPGSYSIIIEDANGCFIYSPLYNITEPLTILSASLFSPILSCFGDTTSIIVSVNGGTPNYSFLWDNGVTTQNLNGISEGSFSLTILDENNCELSEDIIIVEPAKIEVTNIIANLSCFEDLSGNIELTVNGGVQPYNYNWSNGGIGSFINNLSANTYQVIITDNNNCEYVENFLVSEPSSLEVYFQVENVNCFGNSNGEIDITVLGGTPQYSFEWSNFTNNEDLINVSAGNYNLIVSDNNFCTENISININEPSEINFSVQVKDLICFDDNSGEIEITTSGGTAGYIYSIDGGLNYSSNNVFANLESSSYSIWVKDNNNCVINQSYNVNQPNMFSNIGSSQFDVDKCNGNLNASIEFIIDGQTPPYSFSWSNGASTQSIYNIGAGDYEVTVLDDNNCEIIYSYFILEPELIELEYTVQPASCLERDNASITTFVKGGTPPFLYEWSNGESTSDIFEISTGSYSLIVYDSEGCSIPIKYFDVGFDSFNSCVEIPSGFTPNNDNIHDEWVIYGLNDFPNVNVKVFNRWGQQVFNSQGYSVNWDGKFEGEDLPSAVYYYIIELNQSEKVFNGSVTIKR